MTATERYNRNVNARRLYLCSQLAKLTDTETDTIYDWVVKDNVGAVRLANHIDTLNEAAAVRATIDALGS